MDGDDRLWEMDEEMSGERAGAGVTTQRSEAGERGRCAKNASTQKRQDEASDRTEEMGGTEQR